MHLSSITALNVNSQIMHMLITALNVNNVVFLFYKIIVKIIG